MTILPANEAAWKDIELVLGTRGDSVGCWCQRFKMPSRAWHYREIPAEERARRMQEQTHCGEPDAETTGLVAYLDHEPVGWCAVEPRANYLRFGQTPWKGRNEDPSEPGIWALTCFVVRHGFRNQGITSSLTQAAVAFARERGARAIEGYPMMTEPGKEITWGELHVGPLEAFLAAGFREVSHPSLRRFVMRIDF